MAALRFATVLLLVLSIASGTRAISYNEADYPNPFLDIEVVDAGSRKMLQASSGGSSSSTAGTSTSGSSSACSSAKVTTSGNGFGRAESSSRGQAVSSAASACASAITDAYSGGCGGGSIFGRALIAIEACTQAAAAVKVSSFSKTNTFGNVQACASGCALASAESSAMAKATGEAFANAFGCDSEIGNYVKGSTFQQAWAKVDVAGYTYACSKGAGSAFARSGGIVQAMASNVAKIFGEVHALACKSNTTCGGCYCIAGAEGSASDALAESADGTYGMAKQFSDATAAICKGGNKTPEFIKVKASSYVQIAASLCANALVKLTGCAATSGADATACSVTIGSGQASSAIQAMIQSIQYAFANSIGAECSSSVDIMANSFVQVDDLVSCCESGILAVCSYNGSGQITLQNELVKCFQSKVDNKITDAFANGIANVVNTCNCAGADWCCSTCGHTSCGLYNTM